MRMLVALGIACVLTACGDNQLRLSYQIVNVPLASAVRVETVVRLAPEETRQFVAESTFHLIAQGVGYEVRDGEVARQMLITHDADLGFQFHNQFVLALTPPANMGAAPQLLVRARLFGNKSVLAETDEVPTKFSQHDLTLSLENIATCGEAICKSSETCCDGACIKLSNDPANCGACGNACGDSADACVQGRCTCVGGPGCKDGKTCCAGTGCADVKADRYNCGACGTSCNLGEQCKDGVCACGSQGSCDAPPLCCVDAVGAATCSTTGTCSCGTSGECAPPNECCGGNNCTNTKTDDENCGACGHQCPNDTHCSEGRCVCGTSTASCETECCGGNTCVDKSDDPVHCGACNEVCGEGLNCTAGVCTCGTTSCSTNDLCCGGSCLQNTPANCGGCGLSCKSGESCDLVGGIYQCRCGNEPACAAGRKCCSGLGSGIGTGSSPTGSPSPSPSSSSSPSPSPSAGNIVVVGCVDPSSTDTCNGCISTRNRCGVCSPIGNGGYGCTVQCNPTCLGNDLCCATGRCGSVSIGTAMICQPNSTTFPGTGETASTISPGTEN